MCLIALAVGVVQCLTYNALQRIWEDRIWKLVPKAGYPGAREIPISLVPSLDDQWIGVRSSEVSDIAVCCTSHWLCTLTETSLIIIIIIYIYCSWVVNPVAVVILRVHKIFGLIWKNIIQRSTAKETQNSFVKLSFSGSKKKVHINYNWVFCVGDYLAMMFHVISLLRWNR